DYGLTEGSRQQRFIAMMTKSDGPSYPDTEEGKERLLEDLLIKQNDMMARLSPYFWRLPETKLDIRRVPEYLEAGAPMAYYQDPSIDGTVPGIFYVNLENMKEIPYWILTTTAFHEGIPGHHFQQAVLLEGPRVHDLRKVLWSSGYSEGWALYAEQLAFELGMYQEDPAGRIGCVWAELLRAVRLVVDTGIQAKKWSLTEAVSWMTEHGGFPESLAVGEVERNCVWPGQACSYLVGKVMWLAARERAQTLLGENYDIRDFHEATLAVGSVPLTLFDQVVDQYIAQKQAS
ncbi:MAG: DUF885 family protein, partial [Pseudomonadota bacterium]